MRLWSGTRHIRIPSAKQLREHVFRSLFGYFLRCISVYSAYLPPQCDTLRTHFSVREGVYVEDKQLRFENAANLGLAGFHGLLDYPSKVAAFASLLRSYGKAKALSFGRHVHAHITKQNYDRNRLLKNCLIELYGSCGSVKDSRAVFDSTPKPNMYSWNILIKVYCENGSLDDANIIFSRMPCRDVVSWTAIIAGFSQNGLGKEALDLFFRMQLEGVTPNNITLVCTLDACTSLEALNQGQETHSAIVELGYERDVVMGTALVNMYGKCGCLHDAKKVFGRLPHRDVVSWNAMIAALAHNHHGEEALGFFQQMQLDGLEPDRISFVCVLNACGSLASLKQGKVIHAAIIDFQYEEDVAVGNTLISMYGKCGSVLDAKVLFVKMSHRTVVSWNAMITAFSENGYGEEALDIYYQMQIEGIVPDKISFLSAIDACTGLAALAEGQEVHATLVSSTYDGQDVLIGNALINLYGKCQSLNEARNLFDSMANRNSVSWNSLIAVYCCCGHGINALDLYHQMQIQGMKPDKVTFLCALDACASLAAHDEGHAMHCKIVHMGCERDVMLGNALVNMYGKCGNLVDARSVFGKMQNLDSVSWTAMISAFAQNGNGKEALDFFCKMQLEGMMPDEVAFTCALCACNHTGQVDDGKHLFASMNINHGIKYTEDHYLCMVDLLGRSGCLDEAENLIKNIPSEQVSAAWLCLLGACSIHRDVERGVCAASHCFELDPNNPTPYVMLSNIHAAAGNWDNVATLREAIRNIGVRKQLMPALSWQFG